VALRSLCVADLAAAARSYAGLQGRGVAR